MVSRQVGAAAVGVAFLGLVGTSLSCSGEVEPSLTLEEQLEADDRIAALIAPCGHGRQFTADTSDMTRVLANNLVFSEVEPLRRSKAELAAMGEGAVADLKRVFDEAYADKWQHGVLENVLGVCALMDGPAGMPIVREGLRHPNELVRLTALDGLRKHGGPQDYEVVLLNISLASTIENRADCAVALHSVDPERFYLDVVQWLEDGEWPGLWKYVAPPAAEATDEVTLARYAALAGIPIPDGREPLVPEVRSFLLGALAVSGNEAALLELRGELSSDAPQDRDIALRVLERIGLVEEARTILEQDDIETLRARAAKLLGEQGDDSVIELLRGGLSDPGPSVRTVCLEELLKRGDGPAQAQALEMLRQGIKPRAQAMRALRLGWDANPDAPERAYEVLSGMIREQAQLDTSQAVGLLQNLSQVPLRATAEFIMDVGLNSTGVIRGWPAHRWCAFQVYNVGPKGLAYLRELHAAESDPLRRIDYLAAIWQDHSDEARDTLRGVVLDERSTPQEKLYAADRLVHIGPAAEQAPFLKRVYFETTHERVRPALQCLLWRWYGS